MGATIVVGGQYGSEGKGKTVALAAAQKSHPWVVRCGGPNSGHTLTICGEDVVLRQLPCATEHPNSVLLLSAGCAIDEAVLVAEIRRLKVKRERLIIDPRAVLIEESDRRTETQVVEQIASTGTGTGAALARRMSRLAGVRLADNSDLLREHARVESIAPLLHDHLDSGGDVIVEGTQGFGLSLLHGPVYPFVTSRDTTASGFAAEVGLSPRQVNEIIMVVRTFPIRVGGPSGPLPGEIDWEEIQRISGARHAHPEFTSVTNRLRRVASFDLETVRLAALYNRPTALAVMGIDRLDYSNNGARALTDISPRAVDFLIQVQDALKTPVQWVGTGFGTNQAIEVTGSLESLLSRSVELVDHA